MSEQRLIKSTEKLSSLERFLLQSKESGVPRGQIKNFIGYGYVPLPRQLLFHAAARKCDESNGPTKVGFGGARGPGKSHGVFAQVTLDDCQRIGGLKVLFLRQTGVAAQESFQDLIYRILTGRISYEYINNTLKFGNGSRILLGGFRDEKDVDKYIGIEYDLIVVEELNQLTGKRVEKLLGSLRTSKENWRPRFYASFNPGGIGHTFVKKLFIEPFIFKTEEDTKFIPSGYKDNPFLNKEYITYLENLQGDLAKKWREGNWDVAEGQYFDEWDAKIHVINPFPIPEGWRRIRGIDHGRTNPTACLWGAVDFDGRIYWYREYYSHRIDLNEKGKDADENAKKIAELSEGEGYKLQVMDSACYAKTGSGETIAEIYQRNGVYSEPWPKNRIAGWNLFHEYLRKQEDGRPKMMFFNTCTNAIRTIPSLIHDERNTEDIDTDGEDHCADAIRGILEYLHEAKSPKPKNVIEQKLEKFKVSFKLSPMNLNKFYSNS